MATSNVSSSVELIQDHSIQRDGLTDPLEYVPDGGMRAWRVVFGGFCCLFCSFGWINCTGILQDYYQNVEFRNTSPSVIAWVSSTETFTVYAFGPIFGRIIDNQGPRLVLTFGSAMHILGLLMLSLASKYYQVLLAQGICSSIGISAIYYAAITSVSTWFRANRALAFGIISCGSSLGGIVYPIMMTSLIGRIGFSSTVRCITLLMSIILLIANVTVKSRLRPIPSPIRIAEFITPFREYAFVLTCLGSFLFCLGMFIPFNFISIQAQSYGMSAIAAGYLVVALNAASLFGRVLQGYVADHVGRFNVVIATTAASGILVLTLWLLSESGVQLFVFAGSYGFLASAFTSLAPALVAQISAVRQTGTRIGIQSAVMSVAILLGSPIGGQLLKLCNGSFAGLQVFTGATMLASSSAFLIPKLELGRGILSKI